MGREQACQLVSFLARQLGAYHSGRPRIGFCHKLMITGRLPSYHDQHAETRLIQVVAPLRAPETALAGHEVRLPYSGTAQARPVC